MAIVFLCPCRTRLQVADDAAGKRIRCPSCGKMLVAPRPPAPRPVAIPAVPAPVPRRPPAPRAAPKLDRKVPSPPRRRWPLLVGLAALFLVVLVSVPCVLLLLKSRRTGPLAVVDPGATAHAVDSGRATTPDGPGDTQPGDRPPPVVDLARASELDTGALERLNRYRQAAGLAPVALDRALCQGCDAHARYLARNFIQLYQQRKTTSDEDSSSPGYSDEGRDAARVAFSVRNTPGPLSAIDQWMASLFLRPWLLDPELQRIGWGQAHHDTQGWFSVLDVSRGRGSAEVVVYPATGQKEVPLKYPGTEVPDPIPEAAQKVAGYPITVTFPRGLSVHEASARLLVHNKEEVPVWLSTPEQPAQNTERQLNTVCLIARAPLEANTRYSVTVSARVAGAPWSYTWSFTTGAGAPNGSAGGAGQGPDPNAILAQVNAYRKKAALAPVALDSALSRGCQTHADYLARNADNSSTEGLGGHNEDPHLPGFTEEGRKAGLASNISFDVDPLLAVDNWMATLFHRVPLLHPDLKRIGFALARKPGSSGPSGSIVILDVQGGLGDNRPIFCPADGQKEVALAYYAGERPDPIPESKTRRAGYPITVAFPRAALVKDASAQLTDQEGVEVPCWLSTPEKTVDAALQRNTVALIAQQPLRPNTTYRATATAQVDGAPWSRTWSFTTGDRE